MSIPTIRDAGIDELFHVVVRAESEEERERSLTVFLRELHRRFVRGDPTDFAIGDSHTKASGTLCQAFQEASTRERAWGWIESFLREPPDKEPRKQAFEAAFLHRVATLPVEWLDDAWTLLVDRILSLLHDEELSWVVFLAWRLTPQKLLADLAHYEKWRWKRGQPALDPDWSAIESWVQETRFEPDDDHYLDEYRYYREQGWGKSE